MPLVQDCFYVTVMQDYSAWQDDKRDFYPLTNMNYVEKRGLYHHLTTSEKHAIFVATMQYEGPFSDTCSYSETRGGNFQRHSDMGDERGWKGGSRGRSLTLYPSLLL